MKNSMVLLISILFVILMGSNAFCVQINSSFNPSPNTDNLKPLIGTKWAFSYNSVNGTTVAKTFEFGSTPYLLSDGTAALSCTDEQGITTNVFYGGIPLELGGESAFTISFPAGTSAGLFTFKINRGEGISQIASGLYTKYNFYDGGYYSYSRNLTGNCTYAPETQPTVRDSECVVTPKSLTMNLNRVPTTQDFVQFTVDSVSDCSYSNFYYYFAYAPDYGTPQYDGNRWVRMLSDDGFTTNQTISYNFSQPGYYVLVAWVSKTRSIPDPINMVGMTVKVK